MTRKELDVDRTDGKAFPVVTEGTIGADTVSCVNARDLHAFLGVGKNFSNWIQDRIGQYGFQETRDFEVFTETGENPSGGRPAKEYAITIDMAKELSMVERTEKGKQARAYFLECERRAKAPRVTAEDLIANPHQLLAIAQGYALQIEDLKRDKATMQTDVDVLDRIAGSDDLFGIRVAAKLLDTPEKKFIDWLLRNRWAYRMNGTKQPLCYAEKHRAGLCRNVATSYDKSDGTTGVRETLKFTVAGIVRIAKALNVPLTEDKILASDRS